MKMMLEVTVWWKTVSVIKFHKWGVLFDALQLGSSKQFCVKDFLKATFLNNGFNQLLIFMSHRLLFYFHV